MEDQPTQNTSPNPATSYSPPTPPSVDVVVPGTQPVPENLSTPSPEWPTKKQNKMKPLVTSLLAVFLVVGAAAGAFYFSRNLNSGSTPVAPSSNPFAATPKDTAVKKPAATKKPAPTTVKTTGGAGNGNFVAGEKDDRYSQVFTANDTVLSNGTVVNNQKNTTSCDAGYYSCQQGTKCCKIGAVVTEKPSKGNETAAVTCTNTTWTPNPNTKCKGTKFTQTSNCGNTRQADGTKTDGTCATCTDTTWTPDVNTACLNVAIVQTSNCDATRSATGTKTDGTCACVDTTWTPNPNTVCDDDTLIQTSNCGTKKTVDGTKACGDADMAMEKVAYRDESSNAAGSYKLTTEIDTVEKDQIFVYAFLIANGGDAKANEIVVTDTLKGDNQELLTLVDAESRCKYVSSTRKITCSGMSLDAGKTDKYTFRVKVSDSAVNGETIKNIGVMSYKEMPADGEIEASLELNISTVVGCNNTCTSDDECVSGLSCDVDTNKCRRPSCSDSSSCNCPKTVTDTPEPTQRTVAKAKPTVLPETGILDFPGVAAFGGGLLLAIVGILLAL